MKKNQKGFTLVELIVVIAIAAILSGIAVPTYIAYIDEANKAADQQLVADTAYAMSVGNRANGLAYQAGSGTLGYIILSDSDDVVVKDTLKDDTGTRLEDSTKLENAMKNAFGDDYASTLRLKYGKWTDAVTMLGQVVDNDYAESVNLSSYINNIGTAQLLDDVQNCATSLANFMSNLDEGNNESAYNVLAGFFPGKLDDVYAAAGMTPDDSTGESLANATVICIADYVNSNKDEVASSFYDTTGGMNDLILSKNLLNFMSSDQQNLLNNTATWYAAGEALVSYLNDEQCTQIFKSIDMHGNTSDILGNMNSAYSEIRSRAMDTNTQDLNQKFLNYYNERTSNGKTQAQLDGESYVSIMSTVNNLSGDYTNKAALNTNKLFGNDNMVDRIDSFVAAASLKDFMGDQELGDLQNATGSNVLVIVTTDGKGNVGCIAAPSDVVF